MQTTVQQEAQLERFVRAVEASPHNLVSRRARDELRERHLPECAAFARALPAGPARLLDVGSGGGFPGMVVAILRPDLEVTLLDATRKKVEFLHEVAEDLGVSVRAVHGRAEELHRTSLGSSQDIVTARAVAPLDRLVGWTVPFLVPGGFLYAIKGQRWEQELAAAAPALREWGAETVATPEELAEGPDGARPLVVIIRRSPGPGAATTEGNR
jgi:16S rRNA (guanine527-N7)-methyltransferase